MTARATYGVRTRPPPGWVAGRTRGGVHPRSGDGQLVYVAPPPRIIMLLLIMDRSRMTARVVPLTSDDAGDSRMGGTAEERVAAVTTLTLEVWRLSGRELPTYTRATMPIVVTTLKQHGRST